MTGQKTTHIGLFGSVRYSGTAAAGSESVSPAGGTHVLPVMFRWIPLVPPGTLDTTAVRELVLHVAFGRIAVTAHHVHAFQGGVLGQFRRLQSGDGSLLWEGLVGFRVSYLSVLLAGRPRVVLLPGSRHILAERHLPDGRAALEGQGDEKADARTEMKRSRSLHHR
jgi:hypothetical protein